MKENLFRKKSLDQLHSPKRLTQHLKVVHLSVWIILIIIIFLIIGFVVWGEMVEIKPGVRPIDYLYSKNKSGL